MLKRVYVLLFIIVGLISFIPNRYIPTVKAATLVAPGVDKPRPSRNTTQSAALNEGENVLWFDDTTITGVKLDMSSGRGANFYNTSAPWELTMLHTMRPPYGCIEVVIGHYRDSANVMHNTFGLAPWCGGLNAYTYNVSLGGTFAANYLRVLSVHNYNPNAPKIYNDEIMHVKVTKVAGNNCWQASVYNYNTSTFDVLGNPATVCGTYNDPVPADGWTSFEQHWGATSVCDTLGTYKVEESRNIEVEYGIGTGYWDIDLSKVSYTDLGATRCEPSRWKSHHVIPNWLEGGGYVLCEYAANTNCD